MALGEYPHPAVEAERQRTIDRFLALREANMAAYGATSEEQFTTSIGGDISDQRTYLIHQIEHTHSRVKAIRVNVADLPNLQGLTRDQLVIALGNTGDRLRMVFELGAWDKMVRVPFSDRQLRGETVLNDVIAHEAHHEGMNRVVLGHFGIPLPEAVIKPFGK